jgi:hypothetical protein
MVEGPQSPRLSRADMPVCAEAGEVIELGLSVAFLHHADQSASRPGFARRQWGSS